MSGSNFRNAFIVTLVIALSLAIGMFYFWSQSRRQHAISSSGTGSQSMPAMQMQQTSTSQSQQQTSMQMNATSGTQPAQTETQQTPLTPVQLSPRRLQSIGVKFAEVRRQAVRDEIRATGTVEVDEQKLAYVQTRFPGWIQKVFADATYQFVHKGQPLFTIYSQELVSTEQEFLLALRNRQTLAGTNQSRPSREADWLVDAARQRLQQWNVPDAEIARLEKTGQVQREITINSPATGYITERNALPNQTVQPDTKLYTIADLSTVWVYAQVFQNDVGRLKAGDPAEVTVDAYPGRTFKGQVNQILPQVDPNTRTVRVRLVFGNPGLLLKPGMFVNIALGVPLGMQLVIPASGVLQSGMRQIVFVDHGNGYLEPREVETSGQIADAFIVRKGLREGERVVASANFLIDSESQLQAAFGSFAPPPPGAGGAGGTAAVSVAKANANIEFTTDPSPPRKGGNTFRVKLADAGGKPIAGAQVSVTFYMPAMPAMGMAAMRTSVTLTDKGSGSYEGSGTLQSGGTWQVTITAQQNGQMIATKQMTVSASGGM